MRPSSDAPDKESSWLQSLCSSQPAPSKIGKEIVTVPLEVLQVAVKELPGCPRRPSELLQAHVAEVLAVDVKLLERDAAGIQLVGVQEVLEPFPHLVLGPILRMDFMPLASKKSAGNCKIGGGSVSDPCLFSGTIPDGRMHCWLPDVMGNTTAVHVCLWGLEHETSSEEEVSWKYGSFPITVGTNHSASVCLHSTRLTPGS